MDDQMIEEAVRTISEAIEEHDPIKVYALVSGGNDPTVAAHVAARYGPRLDGLVHINIGIDVPQTTQFVHEFAEWLLCRLGRLH